MVKYRIKGRTCSFVLDLPKYIDDNTKDVLVKVFSYCLDKESKDKVLSSVKNCLMRLGK